MKVGDAVVMKHAYKPGPVGILLEKWTPFFPDPIIYWKVLMDGKIKDIKETHLLLAR